MLFLSILVLQISINPVYAIQIDLKENWKMQSSADVAKSGADISTDEFQGDGWYSITVPATVMAGLLENNVYEDPFHGKNLASIPKSQFDKSWWFRKSFDLPDSEIGKEVWLNFSGINYRANIWINGEKLADSATVVGTYRMFEFNITDYLKTDSDSNVIAIEIFKPQRYDLGINFVDWAPHPPDLNMGLFKPVFLRTSSHVALRHAFVKTDVDIPSLSEVRLSVYVDLKNASDAFVTGTLQGTIGSITFSKDITLSALENKTVVLSHDDIDEFVITNPKIWWPWQMGESPLYDLHIEFMINNSLSDSMDIQFGIRKITSRLTDKNHRLFSVNGKDILIRGAGWCPDLFLRRDEKRIEAEIKYVRDMNLNTIRLEGKLEEKSFYDLCDKLGVLVLPGWCCSYFGMGWEIYHTWNEEDHFVAYQSTRDQMYCHRYHPSMLAWMYGSDMLAPEDVEQKYLDVMKEYQWPNPTWASAGNYVSKITGITGGKMSGPYKWEPPIYWYQDAKKGGYFGFNTEAGPGGSVLPLESAKECIASSDLWPIGDVWNYHCGLEHFKDLRVFTQALDNRYGASKDTREYCVKSQVAAYESHRAMFEAYSQNKYTSTGIIQWMLNNAWPSNMWHLYDYFLRPGGSYYGTKVGCKPLHIQYSYNDRNVTVVNSHYTEYSNLIADAYVYTLTGKEKFHKQVKVSLASDEVKKVIKIPEFDEITTTYFVKLTLAYDNGDVFDNNCYWLSLKKDSVDWANDSGYFTQAATFADFSELQSLKDVSLTHSDVFKNGTNEDTLTVTINNPSDDIAFAVHLKAEKDRSQIEILPVLWEDNYFTLFPGDKRIIKARFRKGDLGGEKPKLVVTGWNVKNSNENIVPVTNGLTLLPKVIPSRYAILVYNLAGRKVFEYSSKKNIQKALGIYAKHDSQSWKKHLAGGVYVLLVKMFYNNLKPKKIQRVMVVY